MPWEPLLGAPQRERAVETAVAVARSLAAAPPPRGTNDARPVLNGTLGAVLLNVALAGATGDPAYGDTAVALLDEAVDSASELARPTIALYDAPLGLGWVDAVVRPRLGAPDEDNDLDVFVSKVLSRDSWEWPLDLMHGLAGTGVYCLARLPREGARRDVATIVRHLATNADEDGPGITWRYVPGGAFEFNEYRPEGHVNLGFAHGVPGILAFLAAAAGAGVEEARDLLAPAVRWLDAQRLPAGERAAFPRFVIEGKPVGTGLAWCYGDPGVAVALLLAGRTTGDPGVVGLAREVALGAAARPPGEVEGATICHGSAALGHLYHRLGHALGDERLLDTARGWFDVVLTRDLAGLTVVDHDATKRLREAGVPVAEAGHGFLFGAAGTALALVAAASAEEPWWDGVLFVQPPGSWDPA